jgi:hypothetical protein
MRVSHHENNDRMGHSADPERTWFDDFPLFFFFFGGGGGGGGFQQRVAYDQVVRLYVAPFPRLINRHFMRTVRPCSFLLEQDALV